MPISSILNKSPEEIVQLTVNAYDTGSGIFANKVNAEDLVPKMSDEDKAQYLFWVLQMDYATKSSTLYANANKFYKENPGWIQTDYILSLSESELLDVIKNKFRPRYVNEIVMRLKINAQKLLESYQGKAIKIIKNSISATELLENIQEFRGFGPKLGNFLVRTYIDSFTLGYSDIDEILPPVDIHDVRLSYEWGFISDKDMSAKNIQTVKELWNSACKNVKVSWIKFDKALWLIGSEGIRTTDPKSDFKKNLGLK